MAPPSSARSASGLPPSPVSTTTCTQGASSRIRAVASAPSMTGIARSISTTSGLERAHQFEGFPAVLGLADDVEVEGGGEEELESFADHLVVVDDEDPGATRLLPCD